VALLLLAGKTMPYDAITGIRWDDEHNMVLVDWQSGWMNRTWKGKHFVSTSSWPIQAHTKTS
jgi:hypothetical protein